MTCTPARTAAASSMSPTSRDLVLIVDGASRGNPGPSAIGVVIKDAHGKVLAEIGEYIGEFTNNVAEYRALLRALEEAKAMGAGVWCEGVRRHTLRGPRNGPRRSHRADPGTPHAGEGAPQGGTDPASHHW